MAASLLLRQGRPGTLKTVLLEAGVFRGLAPAVSLSAESGKNEKGLPPNPKKQSPPKNEKVERGETPEPPRVAVSVVEPDLSPRNVVEPKERGQQLAPPTADAVSKTLSAPASSPSVVSQSRTLASPNPDASVLHTDQGLPKLLSRKTLVEFPQKVVSPFRKQGSDSEAAQWGRRGTDDSSSSSSSSSSDSESDEEGDRSGAGPQVKSKRRGGSPIAEASRSSADRDPKTEISGKEKTVSQQPPLDLTPAGRPRQAEKKKTSSQHLEDRKGPKPQTAVPKPHAAEESVKQNVKAKQSQKISRSNKTDKESQKPLEVKTALSDRPTWGLSTHPAGGPAPTPSTGTRAGGQPPAPPPEARGSLLEKQVPEADGELALPLFKTEKLEKQAAEGILKAEEEILEDQLPMPNLKSAPVQNKDVLDEKPAVLKLEEKGGIMEDSAAQVEGQDHTQEPASAAPAEPFDNTTYKNLQHHDYSTYTFLDLNLDLSKFRMPQPSSGRESPRH